MSGYINDLQYDTVTGESIRSFYTIGYPPENGSPTDDVERPADYAYVYTLSNNGQWYAGSTYIQYEGADGNIDATKLGDNGAANEWWNSWVTVYNSSHQASGSSANVNESTWLGKDGNTYVSDIDASGNTIASAEYSTSTGVYITSNNWAPGAADEPAQHFDNVVTTLEHVEFHTVDETLYGNPGAGPNPNIGSKATSPHQTIDLSGVTARELQSDFTSAAKVAQFSSTTKEPVLSQSTSSTYYTSSAIHPMVIDGQHSHPLNDQNLHSSIQLLHML